MTKQDYISLFYSMHKGFFEGESVKGLSEGEVFEEMLLPLKEFDTDIYNKKLPENISFGFYEGDISEIKKSIEKVSPDWVQFFNKDSRIFCGFIDGIGLTMVKLVTEILKNEGYDYSYIHYTAVAHWYAKLGYTTILKWNKKGIIA